MAPPQQPFPGGHLHGREVVDGQATLQPDHRGRVGAQRQRRGVRRRLDPARVPQPDGLGDQPHHDRDGDRHRDQTGVVAPRRRALPAERDADSRTVPHRTRGQGQQGDQQRRGEHGPSHVAVTLVGQLVGHDHADLGHGAREQGVVDHDTAGRAEPVDHGVAAGVPTGPLGDHHWQVPQPGLGHHVARPRSPRARHRAAGPAWSAAAPRRATAAWSRPPRRPRAPRRPPPTPGDAAAPARPAPRRRAPPTPSSSARAVSIRPHQAAADAVRTPQAPSWTIARPRLDRQHGQPCQPEDDDGDQRRRAGARATGRDARRRCARAGPGPRRVATSSTGTATESSWTTTVRTRRGWR